MEENKNPIKNRLSEQLPSHAPDPGSWQRLSAKLDALDAGAALQEKLGNLPVHSPDPATWDKILFRLNRTAYFRTGIRIALSAAAGLLLFFTVSRFSDFSVSTPASQGLTEQKQSGKVPVSNDNSRPGSPGVTGNSPNRENAATIAMGRHSGDISESDYKIRLVEAQPDLSVSENIVYLTTDLPLADEHAADMLAGISMPYAESLPGSAILNSGSEKTTSVLLQKQNIQPITPPKYYTPKEPETGKNKNYFALAMNYLPENIDNGTTTSLFHNVDLTASYNKEKVRFNTSIGMAYNEEELVFDMNYDVKTPVTAVGPGGSLDTVGYDVSRMESQYQGTEQHQYVTYNLGLGRKLFRIGNFSTWITAGAGFGIMVNDADLIASTEKKIQNQYNAQINKVESSQPVYNDVNVNFVTGLDFNYRILKRISISFAPTSRWYFKPVLTQNNQPTDELTLGFKTGMKFDF